MTRGLLVVGHGSQRNRSSRDAVHQQVERIRARGRFDEVGMGFWKDVPSLAEGLRAMRAGTVYVVPMFAAEGYYTREVIPREMRLEGVRTVREQQTIWYCPPAGGHPHISEIIVERAREAGADAATGLVVLGHGTRRSDTSGRTLVEHTDRLRARGLFAEVCPAFIDQEPALERVWEFTRSDRLVLVPLFMAEGWHVRETIPADLDLDAGIAVRGNRSLHMTESVGTHPSLADLIQDLAVAPSGASG